MNKPFWVALMFLLVAVSSCRKDAQLDLDNLSSLSAFAIESETQAAVIDPQNKTITVHIGELMDWQNLKINFTASHSGKLMYEGQALASGSSTLDLTKPVELALHSSEGVYQDTWKLVVNSLIADYGLGSTLHKAADVSKAHSFYFDQGESGTHSWINCGPAVATMAIKWADASFTGTPEAARAAILPGGGWWYTNNIADYLQTHGINLAYTTLATSLSLTAYGNKLINILDRGYVAILCLDMYYVRRETAPDKRINKFYTTSSDEWGHFMLVKGYKVVDDKVWLEVHDPYSIGQQYSIDNQLKGKNRYYAASELKKATDIWWANAIVVAPKGAQVSGLSVVPQPAINRMMHQRGR